MYVLRGLCLVRHAGGLHFYSADGIICGRRGRCDFFFAFKLMDGGSKNIWFANLIARKDGSGGGGGRFCLFVEVVCLGLVGVNL